MKTSDLPDIQKIDDGYLECEPSVTYLAITEDPWFSLHPVHLWDMSDEINTITHHITVHIYDHYHA